MRVCQKIYAGIPSGATGCRLDFHRHRAYRCRRRHGSRRPRRCRPAGNLRDRPRFTSPLLAFSVCRYWKPWSVPEVSSSGAGRFRYGTVRLFRLTATQALDHARRRTWRGWGQQQMHMVGHQPIGMGGAAAIASSGNRRSVRWEKEERLMVPEECEGYANIPHRIL